VETYFLSILFVDASGCAIIPFIGIAEPVEMLPHQTEQTAGEVGESGARVDETNFPLVTSSYEMVVHLHAIDCYFQISCL